MKSYEKYVSKENINAIHEASLKILSTSGVIFEHDGALELLKKSGVRVEDNIVYFSEADINKALSTAPSKFEFRLSHNQSAKLGEGAMIREPIGHPNYYSDYNGKIHPMTTDFAIRQFLTSETSSLLDLSEVNYAILNNVQTNSKKQKIFGALAFLMKYATKPIDTHSAGAEVNGLNEKEVYNYTKEGIDLIKNFKGIDNGIFVYTTINALSPLMYHNTAISQMIAHMDSGQAFGLTTCGMPLLTCPGSLAGLLSQVNAEILAGITFSQFYKPGTPVLYANTSGATDMRTIQLCIGSAEAALSIYATAGLADFYHLPFRTGGALSDAKQLDAQAGAESMLMMQATNDVKPDYILHYSGCMCSFNAFNCEKFILDEETSNIADRLLRGVDINEKTLAVDQIIKAGPSGSFMSGRTPKTYRKDFYLCDLFNKDDPNNWQKNGSKSINETAHDIIENRIQSYIPPILETDQEKLIAPLLPDALKDLF